MFWQLQSAQRNLAAALNAAKLGSSASLSDCMMRNAYRYRYMLIIDFDEFIVPRLHGNYTHLIRHISLKYPPHSQPHTYTFRNTYFFLDLKPDVQQPAHMRTASFRQRVPPSPTGVSV